MHIIIMQVDCVRSGTCANIKFIILSWCARAYIATGVHWSVVCAKIMIALLIFF